MHDDANDPLHKAGIGNTPNTLAEVGADDPGLRGNKDSRANAAEQWGGWGKPPSSNRQDLPPAHQTPRPLPGHTEGHLATVRESLNDLDPTPAEKHGAGEPGEPRFPRERFIHPLTREALLARWDEESPSRTPRPHEGLSGLVNKVRGREPTPRVRPFAGEHLTDGHNALAHYVKVNAGSDTQDDARGWVLQQLGVPADEFKDTMEPIEAQALIAKGLDIPPFHAALFDHVTRAVPPEQLHEVFRDVLLHPDRYASPQVAAFAELVGNYTTADWERIRERHHAWGNVVQSTAHKEQRQQARGLYPQAIRDVAAAAIGRLFEGETARILTQDTSGLIGDIAVQLQTGGQRLDTLDQSYGF